MKTSIGKTAIELASGDITRLDVDAIANAASSELRMGSGVAGAIKRAGGDAVETEAMQQGPIEVGQAVATAGHHLKARWVIHAAVMGEDRRTSAAVIAKATYSSLDCAARHHVRSVALPAFGTGVGGFSLYPCASIMVAETVRYLKDHPHTALSQVMFATYSDAARAAFKNALAGIGRF
jgi:O-acetyl-ADP-ribose deacetylase